MTLLVSTTPNEICASTTLAILATLGAIVALIVGTQPNKPTIDMIPNIVILSSFKTIIS